MPRETRLYELDLLRFIAACAVLFHHLAFKGQVREEYVYYEFHAAGELALYGYLGVDLFFLISGFVILMSASNSTPASFATGRAIRLLPAYLLAVLVTAAFRLSLGGEALQTDLREILLNLTLFAGFFDGPLDFELMDGVYWSLFVELKFYLLIFLVLLTRQMVRIEGLLVGWFGFTVASNFVDLPQPLGELLFPEWAPYFIAGAMFYRVREHGPGLLRLAVITGCLVASLVDGIGRLDEAPDLFDRVPDHGVVLGLIGLAYGLFALLSMDLLRFLRFRWLLPLGALTYPLYLVHQNIGYILLDRTLRSDNDYVVLATVAAAMFVLAWLIHRLVERPLGLYLGRFRPRSGLSSR